MDEIEKRLREGADNCIKFYEAWRANEKDSKGREALLEAVHELRKVAARMEIEMAISERNEMAARPIPIPPHRASRKRHGGEQGGGAEDHHQSGNQGPKPQQGSGRKGPPRKKRTSGGSGGGGSAQGE